MSPVAQATSWSRPLPGEPRVSLRSNPVNLGFHDVAAGDGGSSWSRWPAADRGKRRPSYSFPVYRATGHTHPGRRRRTVSRSLSPPRLAALLGHVRGWLGDGRGVRAEMLQVLIDPEQMRVMAARDDPDQFCPVTATIPARPIHLISPNCPSCPSCPSYA